MAGLQEPRSQPPKTLVTCRGANWRDNTADALPGQLPGSARVHVLLLAHHYVREAPGSVLELVDNDGSGPMSADCLIEDHDAEETGRCILRS